MGDLGGRGVAVRWLAGMMEATAVYVCRDEDRGSTSVRWLWVIAKEMGVRVVMVILRWFVV